MSSPLSQSSFLCSAVAPTMLSLGWTVCLSHCHCLSTLLGASEDVKEPQVFLGFLEETGFHYKNVQMSIKTFSEPVTDILLPRLSIKPCAVEGQHLSFSWWQVPEDAEFRRHLHDWPAALTLFRAQGMKASVPGRFGIWECESYSSCLQTMGSGTKRIKVTLQKSPNISRFQCCYL